MGEGERYLTEEKKKELEKELLFLKTVRRKEIAEALEFAKSLGELSENAEYQEAREEQANAEDRIAKLEEILKYAVVVSGHRSQKAELASTLVIKRVDSGEETKIFLVGSDEASLSQNKISNESPLCQAVFGKKKGDQFSVNTPRGSINYELLDIL